MNLITIPCLRCRVEPVTIPESQKIVGGICEHCIETENLLLKEHNRNNHLKEKWNRICPTLYQDTEIDRLPHPMLSMKALKWPYLVEGLPGKSARWIGVNLWGYPRTGKTRTMFLILKKAHFEGRSVKVFGPSQFAQELEMRDFKTASWMRGVTAFDIVAFDDIDKCKLTRQQEDKFFALLDSRISRRLPTFFTGNTHGDDLKLQFRNGEAIIARMREHSVSIHFPQQQTLSI